MCPPKGDLAFFCICSIVCGDPKFKLCLLPHSAQVGVQYVHFEFFNKAKKSNFHRHLKAKAKSSPLESICAIKAVKQPLPFIFTKIF